MDGDRRLERLCERVTLVKSLGNRRRGELCVMSFVALLAGEGHTDHPVSASPLIRSLAIVINDALPDDERQRLKPFAPRILGTNDGRDEDRVEVLRQVLSERLLPEVRRDRPARQAAQEFGALAGCLSGRVNQRDPEADIGRVLAQIEGGVPRHRQPMLGSTVGELLAWCMHEAITQERRAWYRGEAVILLDRLCDVGAETRRHPIQDDRITRAEERLDGTWLSGLRQLLAMLSKASERSFLDTPPPTGAKDAFRSEAARPQPDIVGGSLR
jgi:hypothetical protein